MLEEAIQMKKIPMSWIKIDLKDRKEINMKVEAIEIVKVTDPKDIKIKTNEVRQKKETTITEIVEGEEQKEGEEGGEEEEEVGEEAITSKVTEEVILEKNPKMIENLITASQGTKKETINLLETKMNTKEKKDNQDMFKNKIASKTEQTNFSAKNSLIILTEEKPIKTSTKAKDLPEMNTDTRNLKIILMKK